MVNLALDPLFAAGLETPAYRDGQDIPVETQRASVYTGLPTEASGHGENKTK